MRDLQETKAGFQLWYYLAENQNGYVFALSSKYVEKELGIKIKAYNAAIAALIEKGYLVPTDKNNYIFYEKSSLLQEDIHCPVGAQGLVLSKDNNYPPRAQEILQYYNNNTNNIINEKGIEKITRAELESKYSEAAWYLDSNIVRFEDSNLAFLLVD